MHTHILSSEIPYLLPQRGRLPRKSSQDATLYHRMPVCEEREHRKQLLRGGLENLEESGFTDIFQRRHLSWVDLPLECHPPVGIHLVF